MATDATQTAVPASTTADMDDPTIQGQIHETPSVHSNPEKNLEEGQEAPQSPQQERRGRSRERARNVSRYVFKDLKVEDAPPNDRNLSPGEPDYFQSLVASSLNTRNLPAVTTATDFHQDETAPLYPFATDHLITSQDLGGDHGTALALELAIKLQKCHIAAKIRSQMIKVAEDGSTSDTDLKRMRGLLFKLNNQYQLRSELGPHRDVVLKSRLDAGDLFPRDVADENEVTVHFETPQDGPGEQGRGDSRSRGSRRANQQPRRLHFIRNVLGRFKRRFRSRDADARSDTVPYWPYANANRARALEEGPPAASGYEHGSVAKVMKSTAAVIVLIVCFVPELIKLLLQNSEKTPRRKWRTTIKEAYKNQVQGLEYARKTGFPQRLGAALVGGLSLITPMLIMSLDPSLKKSLITTSVFILVFGFVLAWRTSMQAGDVLTATATYAAVLVVFTGVSN
ncbi:hypothetical protein CSOJ01_12719 [Colletotrichum sojae]|uniref:DUF6594 domain-containing protein n=1 Tax=Colletotrichum sojae TaxID=2175907 RepID=A0A8H6MM89_9PEZI|nr:hypothetical protein CSOJ01_12719 [Colletotrichum sojae]